MSSALNDLEQTVLEPQLFVWDLENLFAIVSQNESKQKVTIQKNQTQQLQLYRSEKVFTHFPRAILGVGTIQVFWNRRSGCRARKNTTQCICAKAMPSKPAQKQF